MLSEIQFEAQQIEPQGREYLSQSAWLELAVGSVCSELNQVRQTLKSLIPARTREAELVVGHVLAGDGKLIRPAMFLMCCRLSGYCGPQMIPVACICEFVHTASLLHDDVVDNSPLRRNKPTANKIWGDETAVLVGDLIYSTASGLMAETGELDLVRTFAYAIRKMSEGELLHLEELFSADMTQERYFRILSGKTGSLMGAACKSAGILAGLSPEQQNALAVFGHDLGMAFQLTDDALDYLGEEHYTGKKTLSDFREGKVTLPVLLLHDYLSSSELQNIRDILKKQTIDSADVQHIAGLVRQHKTAGRTLELARAYTENASQILERNFPDSPHRRQLISLSRHLSERCC